MPPKDALAQIKDSYLSGETKLGDITWDYGEKKCNFDHNEFQQDFLNSKKRHLVYLGGVGAGKTLVLILKTVLMCLIFPGNRVLLGRDTLTELYSNTLIDFYELVPPELYKINKSENTITFTNGSQIVLFGLEAMQSGAQKDIKKAEQKLKSLNLGFVAVDQAEALSEDVYKILQTRLRRLGVMPQIALVMNPVGNWMYDFFKNTEDEDRQYIETPTRANEKYLPEDYIKDLEKNPKEWVDRYVRGIWSPGDIGNIFYDEWITEQFPRPADKIMEGLHIWEQPVPGATYTIGMDPTEGVTDSAAIVVVNELTGRQVASWSEKTTISNQAAKVLQVARMYAQGNPNSCMIIPEANSVGLALIEAIKDDYPNIYRRKKNYGKDNSMNDVGSDLGFKTTRASKPLLITHMQELFRQGYVSIYDKRILDELGYFQWSDIARQQGAGAPPGKHDDMVIATMLAYLPVEKVLSEQKRGLFDRFKSEQGRKKPQFDYN